MRSVLLRAVPLWALAAVSALAANPDVEYLFDDEGDLGEDSAGNLTATVNDADWEATPRGGGLLLDGESAYLHVPDSGFINTGGPFPKRSIVAIFKADDAEIGSRKQVIFEEGGRTRGAALYVFEGSLWVGAWNRAEYNWNGEWIDARIDSGRWHHAALVIRDAKGAVEPDRFEMWLDGSLVDSRSGGQLHAHGDNNGIGAIVQNVVFHDEGGAVALGDYFAGVIEEVRIYNESLTRNEIETDARDFLSIEPAGKLAARWGDLKTE